MMEAGLTYMFCRQNQAKFAALWPAWYGAHEGYFPARDNAKVGGKIISICK
jgi:hypothetical protein